MDAEEWREDREKQREGRDVMRAERAARKNPLEKLDRVAARSLRLKALRSMSTLDGAAKVFGRIVVTGMVDAGASKEEVQAARERMMRWLRYLREYESDVAHVRGDEAISPEQKRELLSTMAKSRDEFRREIFG